MSTFSHQILSEYYGNNRYVSIESNPLNKFSALEYSSPFWKSDNVLTHALFHSFLFDDNKKDDATTAAQSKYIIELLQNRQLILVDLFTI